MMLIRYFHIYYFYQLKVLRPQFFENNELIFDRHGREVNVLSTKQHLEMLVMLAIYTEPISIVEFSIEHKHEEYNATMFPSDASCSFELRRLFVRVEISHFSRIVAVLRCKVMGVNRIKNLAINLLC